MWFVVTPLTGSGNPYIYRKVVKKRDVTIIQGEL